MSAKRMATPNVSKQVWQISQLRAALEACHEERDWLYALVEEQTCSDLCDKTYEVQGCPPGNCARLSGLKKFREVTEQINRALKASE